jgi:hypothetical protein
MKNFHGSIYLIPVFIILFFNFCGKPPEEKKISSEEKLYTPSTSDTMATIRLPPGAPVPIGHLSPLSITIKNNAPGNGNYTIKNTAAYNIVCDSAGTHIPLAAGQSHNFVINDANPYWITFTTSDPANTMIDISITNNNPSMQDAEVIIF